MAQLATEVHVTEATVSRWETGERGVPDSMKLAFAEFFRVPVPVLFEFHYDLSTDALCRLLDALTAVNAKVEGLESEVAALREERVA